MYPFLVSLFHATILLSVSGIVVLMLFRFCSCRSPKIQGLAWALVLLQGVLWFRLSLDLPILEPEKPPTPAVVHAPEAPQTPFVNYDFPIRNVNHVPQTFRETDFKTPEAEPEKETASLPETVLHAETEVFAKEPEPVGEPEPAEKYFSVSRTAVVFFAWLAGLVFLTGRQAVSYLKMLRKLKTAESPCESIRDEWNAILRSQGIAPGRIRLFVTDTMGPGLVKLPRFCAVVVPRSLWEETDVSMRSGILKHEISHFRHGDLLKSCVFRLIGMIHWFNPIAWLALRRFENALEWRADQESFGTYENGCVDFAKTLLAFRDMVPVTAWCRRDFAGNNLVERSKRLLEFRQNQQGDSLMKKSFIIFCATLLLCCGLFRISLTPRGIAEEPQNTDTQTEVIPSTETTPSVKTKDEKPKPINVGYAKVCGKIVLPDGSRGAGMNVQTVSNSGQMEGLPPGVTRTKSTTSKADGSFTLDSYRMGDYMISVFDPEGRFAAAFQTYSLGMEEEYAEEIVFQMQDGVKIEGTVVEENNDKPVPNIDVSVSFYQKHRDGSPATFFKIRTDKDGKYRFATMKDYDVYVNVGGLPAHKAILKMNDPTINRLDYHLEKRLLRQVDFSEISDVNGVPSVKMDFRIPTPFVGRVLKSDGSPASQTWVDFTMSRPIHDSSRAANVKTDSDGSFRLLKRPKNVVVSITSHDYLGGTILNEVYMNWFENDLLNQDSFEFRLKEPCIIRGRLVDSETKKPLAKQMLFYERSSKEKPELLDTTSKWTHTDDQGNFYISNVVDNVRYELYVVPGVQEAVGTPRSPRVVLKTVIPEKPEEKIKLGDLEVDFSKAVVREEPQPIRSEKESEKPESVDPVYVKVHGKVLLPDGSAAVGMKVLTMGVSKTKSGSSGISNSESRSDGKFTIDAFPDGDYMISVFDPKGRFAAASQYYSVDEESEYAKELVFQLEDGVKVEGTVVEENTGKPVPDIEMAVAFYEDEGTSRNTFFKIVTDENGKYRFATTKDHVVFVNIGTLPIHKGVRNSSAKEQLLKEVDFSEISNVNGVPTVKMDFRIAPFVGRVLKSDGSPASQTLVDISPSKPWHILDSKINTARTDADGYFRIAERPKHVVVSVNHGTSPKEVYMNWFEDDLPKEGTFEICLKKACGISGCLVDSETKKPLAKQLLFLERSSKDNPKLFDFSSQKVSTDEQGNFNVRNAVDNVRYEIYVVPGAKKTYGGMPQSPRVVLKTVIPKEPGEKLALGDLEVDLAKAVVREEPGQILSDQDDKKSGDEKSGALDPVLVKVRGKVLLPDGSPAARMEILTTGSTGGTSNSYSQTDGSFSINSFPNAHYMIAVFDPQGRFAAAPQYYSVKNEAVYAEELTFQMEDGIKIEGTVVEENDDKPLPNLKMTVSFYQKKDGKRENDLRSPSFKISTDKNGKYHFAATQDSDVYANIGSLPISKIVIGMKDSMAERHGLKLQKRLIQKVDFSKISNVNGVSTVKMDFRAPTPFVGRVLRGGGKPAVGARIQILSSRPKNISSSQSEFVTADSDGYFRIMERPKHVFVSIAYGSFLQEVYANWFSDDLPKEGTVEFHLKKPCVISGRLIDPETKKPLANQLLLLERSSKENPETLDYMPEWTHTDAKGKFSVRDVVDNVRYELFVVPGQQKYYGGMPGSPRVTLKTVMSEKPGEKLDLGDLEVDFTKTTVKEEPDGWRTKLWLEQCEKVRSGEKKSAMKIVVKKEAQPALDYILENADKEPLASFALCVVPYEKLSEEGQKKQDAAFQSDHIEFKGESLYLANDPIVALEPEGIMSLSQLRGESDSKWNVPKDDASQNGDWKKTPGAINPKILDNYLRDMLEGRHEAKE